MKYPEDDTFVFYNYEGRKFGNIKAKSMPLIKKLLKQKKVI
jgi:hypothetical protein